MAPTLFLLSVWGESRKGRREECRLIKGSKKELSATGDTAAKGEREKAECGKEEKRLRPFKGVCACVCVASKWEGPWQTAKRIKYRRSNKSRVTGASESQVLPTATAAAVVPLASCYHDSDPSPLPHCPDPSLPPHPLTPQRTKRWDRCRYCHAERLSYTPSSIPLLPPTCAVATAITSTTETQPSCLPLFLPRRRLLAS